MARRRLDYRFRGRAIAASSADLPDAVGQLADLWNSRPSLVVHDWGVVRISVTVMGVLVEFDVTDPGVLDAAIGGDTQPLVALIASTASLTQDEIRLILAKTTDVTASVDRIRPPNNPGYWGPDAGYEPQLVLPQAAIDWVAALSQDAQQAGDTERAGALNEVLLRLGSHQNLSVQDLADRSGIPVGTLKAAQARIDRGAAAQAAGRKPRQRLSQAEIAAVVQAYSRSKNAAQVERDLGIPARTVRDVVKRAAQAPSPTTQVRVSREQKLLDLVQQGMSASAAGRQLGLPERTARAAVQRARQAAGQAPTAAALRDRVLDLVEKGLSASAAGRQVGVPERTARQWVHKAKDFPSE